MKPSGHHYVVVFGGAVAGSEAASQLAERGIRVIVFDQNTLNRGWTTLMARKTTRQGRVKN